MDLSRTGEVGEFLDDNQFAPPGGSDNKCGPESIALCIHSVAPGHHNPSTPQDIHRMAHDDYVSFVVGPLIGNVLGGGGIDDPTFYGILEHRGMPYRKLLHDWSIIGEWLQHGYPVIIGGVREDTIHDAGLNGASPYDWDKLDQRWHIITATGLGSKPDRLKFRDTANFRPGPREYFHERFSYSIATAIVPTWMPVPPPDAVRPGGDDMLQITDPFAKQYFIEIAATPVRRWRCTEPHHNHDVIGGILDFYRKIGGAPRLPTSGEIRPNPNENVVYQEFEAGVIVYDPEHKGPPHPAGFEEAYLHMLNSAEVKRIVCG